MQKHSSKIYFIFFILLTLAGFAIYYLFFGQIQTKNQQTAGIATAIALEIDRQNHLQSLRDTLANTEKERKALDTLILPSDGFVPFVESIEKIGRSTGVAMTDSLSTAPDLSSTVGTEFLLVQVNISGSWDNVVRTVALIESMPYALSIDSFLLNKNVTETKRSLWESAFTVRVLKNK